MWKAVIYNSKPNARHVRYIGPFNDKTITLHVLTRHGFEEETHVLTIPKLRNRNLQRMTRPKLIYLCWQIGIVSPKGLVPTITDSNGQLDNWHDKPAFLNYIVELQHFHGTSGRNYTFQREMFIDWIWAMLMENGMVITVND